MTMNRLDSPESEVAFLGAVLLVPASLDVANLVPEDFYNPRHQHVYRAMLELRDASIAIDPVTLGDRLTVAGKLDAIGGMKYLGELASAVPTAANAEHYAEVIRDRSLCRALRVMHSKLTSDDHFADAEAYLAASDTALLEIAMRGGTASTTPPVSQLVRNIALTLDSRRAKRGEPTGVPSGFIDLDRLTSGFQPGELIILAARPSMGKTAFAGSVIQRIAVHSDVPCCMFSIEMGGEQIIERLIAAETPIDSNHLRTGLITNADIVRIAAASKRVMAATLEVHDKATVTMADVRSTCRRWRSNRKWFGKHGKGLVVVDYLQLVRPPQQLQRGKHQNREQEVADVSRGLKALAKDLKCPVLALAQLNRDCEKRADKRPMLSDLRETGQIEQDADVIMFLYRDEVYDSHSQAKGIAEVIIGKQRNGPIGTVQLKYRKEWTQFDNLAQGYDE